jgi:hypothetical protein
MKFIKKCSVIVSVAYLAASILIAVPYYNWQYARDNGFKDWLYPGGFKATAKAFFWPYFCYKYAGRYHDSKYRFSIEFPAGWKVITPRGIKAELKPMRSAQVAAASNSNQDSACFVTVGNIGDMFMKIDKNRLDADGRQRIEKMVKNSLLSSLDIVVSDLQMDKSRFSVNVGEADFTAKGVECSATASGEKDGTNVFIRSRFYLVSNSRYSVGATGIASSKGAAVSSEMRQTMDRFVVSLVID